MGLNCFFAQCSLGWNATWAVGNILKTKVIRHCLNALCNVQRTKISLEVMAFKLQQNQATTLLVRKDFIVNYEAAAF